MADTVRMGYLSELDAQRRVAELGIDILMPVGPAAPFDFVAHLNGSFSRVQVKTAREENGALVFGTATGSYNNRRPLTPQDTDVVLAISPTGTCHAVTPNGKGSRTLRGADIDRTILKNASQLFVVADRSPMKRVFGVSWHARTKAWVVRIRGKHVGYFKNHDEAVAAAQLARAARVLDSPTTHPTQEVSAGVELSQDFS